jgi:hypothetical protein
LNLDPKFVTLVSGGAAFGDHVAVILFLSRGYGGLNLFLPCPWLPTSAVPTEVKEDENIQSHLTSEGKSRKFGFSDTADGKRSHQNFGRMLKVDTIYDIELARQRGATITCRSSFSARNDDVAKSNAILLP